MTSFVSRNSQREYYIYGEWILITCCHCGHELKLLTTWSSENPGRGFFQCPNYERHGGCNFMEWFDPPMCQRAKRIIPELLKRINRQDEEIRSLEMKLKTIKTQSWLWMLSLFV
ncbi:unnamed protein product [Cuscuta europaea]|uniref:GRF-type domain-containing protein n=1 Tax=Cuscuta europaea TaxID=41803 RepID=A0A9P0YNB5_CUSEU|nr:unnamed protein product [Cuscuta europaea]